MSWLKSMAMRISNIQTDREIEVNPQKEWRHNFVLKIRLYVAWFYFYEI